MYSLLFLTIGFSFYVCANAGVSGTGSENVVGTVAKSQNFLVIGNFNECEGKNAANYTLIETYELDATCNEAVFTQDSFDALIQSTGDHQKAVNLLQPLATSVYPAGAYVQYESLYLVTGGPLQGKYVYEKVIVLKELYLKKCSSILGYSYVTSKTAVLLISDKLDLNVLLSPTGAYEAFKKGCTTVCTGNLYIV